MELLSSTPAHQLALCQAESIVATGAGIGDIQPGDIRFRHLTTARDIAEVLHLRDELSLPETIRTAPEFVTLEKKETKPDLSAHLNGREQSSGRSGSFPLNPVLRQPAWLLTVTVSPRSNAPGRLAAWWSRQSTGQDRRC